VMPKIPPCPGPAAAEAVSAEPVREHAARCPDAVGSPDAAR
jgi:hypothetical protein